MSPDHLHLSHLDESGQIRMVDVGAKASTARTAVSEARVRLSAAAFALLEGQERGKGEVLNTARVAGVLAAKRTAELIPLCHSLPLSFVGIDFALEREAGLIVITATCRSDYKTGVEMEAMTACGVAALTIYDMCKAADKGIVIESQRLLYKSGGKSGEWRAPDAGETAAAGLAESAAAARATAAAGAAEAAAPSAAAGTVRLVYFARVAERVGCRAETLPCPAPLTGAALLAQLEARHPELAPVARLKLAVNQQHAQHSVQIQPGDEVAVFEPVTGG